MLKISFILVLELSFFDFVSIQTHDKTYMKIYSRCTNTLQNRYEDIQQMYKEIDISEGYTGSRHLFLAYHSFVSVFFNLYLSLLHLFPVYRSLISVFFILYLSLLRLFPVYPSAKHVFINLYRSVLRLFPVSPSLLSVSLPPISSLSITYICLLQSISISCL